MKEYHKINTVFKRDPETNFKSLLMWDYSEEAFHYLTDNEWVFTEKVDGTNIRVLVWSQGPAAMANGIAFGGKSDNATIPPALLNKLQERFLTQSERLHEIFPEGACLYGEGFGAKIQKGGGNYSPFQDFVLFDVRVGEWWLQRDAVEDIAQKFDAPIVPIIGRGSLSDMVRMAEIGFDSQWGKFRAEGIVARPATELRDRAGRRIITKIKTSDFRC